MSGGSWDYFYGKLEEVVDRLECGECPYRKAMGKKLRPFVEALHAIEWVDSGDWSAGDDVKKIKEAIGEDAKPVVVREIKLELLNTIKELKELLKDEK